MTFLTFYLSIWYFLPGCSFHQKRLNMWSGDQKTKQNPKKIAKQFRVGWLFVLSIMLYSCGSTRAQRAPTLPTHQLPFSWWRHTQPRSRSSVGWIWWGPLTHFRTTTQAHTSATGQLFLIQNLWVNWEVRPELKVWTIGYRKSKYVLLALLTVTTAQYHSPPP